MNAATVSAVGRAGLAEGDWDKSRFTVRSVIVGLLVAVAGILLVWTATLQSSPAMNAFLAGIGTALVTAAILGLVYESFLKRALIRDIREVSRLDNELYSIGLSNVSLDRDLIQMRDLFTSATSLDIVPLHPLTWLDSDSPWLTHLARQRPLHCRIHVPEPTKYSQFLEGLSDRNGELSSTEFCSAKFRECVEHWDQGDEQLTKSNMELFYYAGYPQAGFVVSDDSAVVYVGSAKPNSVDYIAYIYKGESAGPTIARIRQIIRRLDSVPISGATADNRQVDDILPRHGGREKLESTAGAQSNNLTGVEIDLNDRARGDL
ncbi:hypothetical protein ACP6C0_10160 [Mycolicibacterium septicum]|uniref:hypothetical protein n=1 Tax=Mycolicibacterium septicum TaxID=98668 RepID=UPI003CF86E4F